MEVGMRKVGVSSLAAAASFALGWGLLRSVAVRGTPGPSTELLSRITADLILITGAVVAAWYFLTALGAIIAGALHLLGAAPRQLERFLGRFGAPVLRKVATWTTVSTIALGSPALAAASPQPPGSDSPAVSSISEESDTRNASALVDLAWGAAPADTRGAATPPDEPAGGTPERAGSSPSTSDSAATAPADESPHEHVVTEGDTLWAIAEADLRRSAPTVSTEEIAAHWPRWYAANESAIGADPHLILPGMILHAPTSEAT